MPERHASKRLEAWRAAERAEASTPEGSQGRRRAQAGSRRARWAFEDAARAAGADQGAPPEAFVTKMRRGLRRLQEASDGAAGAVGDHRSNAERQPETVEQGAKREADDAEIRRELDE